MDWGPGEYSRGGAGGGVVCVFTHYRTILKENHYNYVNNEGLRGNSIAKVRREGWGRGSEGELEQVCGLYTY